MTDLNALEQEFINEQKGEGSLSIYLTKGDETEYLGFDINPEDIEALYFEGIGIPRWESLQADSVEAQTALYWERFNEVMGPFPFIGKVLDTDQAVDYDANAIAAFADEIGRVQPSSPKAERAVAKYRVAAGRAAEQGGGLRFKPSQIPTS